MRVGLIPMAAKPYHKGHHSLIELASRENDHVKVYVSLKTRARKGEIPIRGSDMEKIWEEEIKTKLPDNVRIVYSGIPVKDLFNDLTDFDPEYSNAPIFTIYTDSSDTRAYADKYFLTAAPNLFKANKINVKAFTDPDAVTRGIGTPDISGTVMRKHIEQGDFESFRQGLPPALDAQKIWDILSTSVVREFVSRLLRKRLVESKSTPRIRNISQDQILELVDSLLGSASNLIFTEKLAGSHLDVLVTSTGEILSRSKAGRSAGADYGPPRALTFVTNALEQAHPPVSNDVNYLFEVIKPEKRPDYIEYFIGDTPVVIEYSGAMTRETKEQLNTTQSDVKFFNRDDIVRARRGLPPEIEERLRDIRDTLENEKLSVARKKEIELEIMSFITGIFGDSILGGRIEGLMVRTGEKMYKIPTKEYADSQLIQAGLYAIFSGRTKIKKSEIKSRILNLATDPSALQSDRIIKDIKRYADAVSAGLPRGIRSFTSPEDAGKINDLLELAASGDQSAALQVYNVLNRKINDVSSWHVH